MDDKQARSPRDHPPASAGNETGADPSIEVDLTEFDPEEYIAAILADIDREVPGVEELARQSESPRPQTVIPPPSVQAVEWVLQEEDRRPSRPAVMPVALEEEGDRFTFPPPVAATPSSIAPVAVSGEDDDEPRLAPHPRKRRSERILLATFAAVGAAIVAVAGYDIGKSTFSGTAWQNAQGAKRVAGALHKVTPAGDSVQELDSVVISAGSRQAGLRGKQRLGEGPPALDIPFDPTATSRALDIATAETLTRCARGVDDPVSVNVRVTFSPLGHASSVEVEAAEDAPEATRACAQRIFSKVRIPRHGGEAMTFTRWLRVK